MNIDTYFSYEGLTYFNSPEKYWQWVYRKIDRNSADKIKSLFAERAKGNIKDSRAFYSFLAQQKNDLIALNFEYSLLRIIADWVLRHLPTRGKIVELGCNTGFLSLYYAINRPDAIIIGLDNSLEAIEQAKRRSSKYKVDNIQFIHADANEVSDDRLTDASCIITGRLLSELFSPVMRFRRDALSLDYQVSQTGLDELIKNVINKCCDMLADDGLLLVTERFPDFDRFERLQNILVMNNFSIDKTSINSVSWQDVSGYHTSSFFLVKKNSEPEIVTIVDLPNPPLTQNSADKATQITLFGIMAYQVWKNLSIRSIIESKRIKWKNGQEIAVQVGCLSEGLNFTYVSSNTDINILSLFESYEYERVNNDLSDYIDELRKTAINIEE